MLVWEEDLGWRGRKRPGATGTADSSPISTGEAMTARRKVGDVRREWPLIRREDGRMEVVCPHGVGHPSQVLTGARWVSSWMGVHGCDGCCDLAAFALAERAHCQVLGIEWPLPRECVHTFDRDGDLGEECCTKCGLLKRDAQRGEVAPKASDAAGTEEGSDD